MRPSLRALPLVALLLLAPSSVAGVSGPVEPAGSGLPARLPDTDGGPGPEWVWISLRGARAGDGTDDLRALPYRTSWMVERWLEARGRGDSRPCIGNLIHRPDDPPWGLRTFPETFDDFVAIATTAVVGTVRERESGFLRGEAATAVWIEIEEVLAGAPRLERDDTSQGLGFAVPAGRFEFAGHPFCSHDTRLDPLPELGDRLLLVTYGSLRPEPGRELNELWPGTSAFVIEHEGAPSLLTAGVARTDEALESAKSLDAILERLRAGGPPGAAHRLALHLERGGAMGEVDVEVLGSDLRPAWTRIAPGGGPEIAVAAAGGAPWRVRAWAEGFWSPRIEVREPGAAVALRLWPATSVRSELVPPRGERPPAQVRLELIRPEDVAGEEMPLDGASIACPVVSAGEMVCAVPAGRWEVVLRAEGFVPIRLGERPLAPAGARIDLGRHELARGIALAGQVLVEAAELDPSGARVQVQPARRNIPSGSMSPDLSRRHLVQEVPVDAGGHFEIEALPVGLYELIATHPACEPASLAVELSGEQPRDRVGPMVLRPPLRLSVEIAPPSAPDGSPWRLDLLGERSGGLEQMADGVADEEGRWRSRPLAAGAYEVRVRAPGGGILAWEETELVPGREWLRIELALVRVAGELRIGRRPFAAKLWFGGRFGEERVPVESDLEGRFEVVLPRPGAWRVDIEGISRPVRATVDGLEIEPAPPGGASEVEIDLPSTQLEGIVLDPAGNPAPEAEVLLVSLGTPPGVTFVASDAGGRFEIEGQPPGNYAAEASQGDRRSQRVEALLAEGLRAPPLELRLAEKGRLRGRVVGPEGPVAGATIFGVPVTGWDAMASTKGELVASGPEGEFEMAFPADAARARLIAMAAGYALAVGTVAAGEGAEPVRIALVRDGGRLEIPRPPGEGSAQSGLVLLGNEPLDPSLLALWARTNRASAEDPEWLSVAQMPAGPYAYCELPPESLFLVFTGAALPAAGACTEGYLPAGGVLRLAPIRPPGG